MAADEVLGNGLSIERDGDSHVVVFRGRWIAQFDTRHDAYRLCERLRRFKRILEEIDGR